MNFLFIFYRHLLAYSNTTSGQSGVVYAIFGTLFAFSLYNFLSSGVFDVIFSKKKIKGVVKSSHSSFGFMVKVFSIAYSFAVFISILYYLVTDTPAFLSESAGVNIFVHAFSFFLAFIVLYFWINRFERSHSKSKESIEAGV